jgi:hypothetical protein
MSRLSTHLPQLVSLALAVIAAAVSHAVHVERSASSRAAESRDKLPLSTAVSGKPRSGSASAGRPAARHGARRSTTGAERAGKGGRASRSHRPPEPVDRSPGVRVAAHPPRARRPHRVDRLRAEPGVERGVDRDFQPLIEDQHAGADPARPAGNAEPVVGPATPSPAASAPPAATPVKEGG